MSGQRLLFLTDDGYTREPDGKIYPNAGDIGYFISEFGDRFDQIDMVVPLTDGPLTDREPYRWADNLSFHHLTPYRNSLQFLRRLPTALLRDLPVVWKAVRRADVVWLRLPALNGPLLYALARLQHKPIGVWVVGDPVAVVESESERGRLFKLRLAGAKAYWKFLQHISRRNPTLAYGREIVAKLGPDPEGRITNFFTSLVRTSDLVVEAKHKPAGAPLRVLYLGRLSPEKGIGDLVEALRLLDDGTIDLQVAGEGPSREALERQADDCGQSITFHGHIPVGPAQTDLLDSCDVLVLPSYSEGVPKTILVAMSRALPVIATRVGGIPDIVTDGETGLLVDPMAPAQLANELKSLMVDDTLFSQLSKGGLAFVADNTVSAQVERAMKALGSAS